MGVSAMGLGMFLTGNKPTGREAEELFETVRGVFGLYSLIVGSFLCMWEFEALTILQLCQYAFSTVANWNAMRQFFKKPDASKKTPTG